MIIRSCLALAHGYIYIHIYISIFYNVDYCYKHRPLLHISNVNALVLGLILPILCYILLANMLLTVPLSNKQRQLYTNRQAA